MQDVSAPIPTLLTAQFTENPPSGQAEKSVEETSKEAMEVDEIEVHKETSLLGSLPEIPTTTLVVTSPSNTTQTIAARLADKSGPAQFYPSVRVIVSTPFYLSISLLHVPNEYFDDSAPPAIGEDILPVSATGKQDHASHSACSRLPSHLPSQSTILISPPLSLARPLQ
jgi:hypothetical protein